MAEDRAYRERLRALAAKCDELGLARQAEVTRQWFVPRDPHRNYLFDPPAVLSGSPEETDPKIVGQWHEAFLALREEQAETLFQQARQSLSAGRTAESYQLLHEVLHEHPDHELARRILGFRHVDGQWRRPSSSRRPRRGIATHPKYGFPARSYWTLETDNFAILTSHSRQAGLELGQHLEGLYRVWKQLFFRYWSDQDALHGWFAAAANGRLGEKVAPRRNKFNVVLFRDREQYLKVLGQPQLELTIGFYVEDQKTAYFYYEDSSSDSRVTEALLPTWYHEATHQLFLESQPAVNRPGNRLNFWVLEGVALYMQSLQRRQGYYTAGGCDADRLQFSRYRALSEHFYMPLSELVQLGRNDLQQHEQIRRLYSQAAGLAAFLMDSGSARYRQAFQDYLAAVYQGRDEASTLATLTKQPFTALDQQYIRFLAKVDDQQLEFVQEPQKLCLARTEVTDDGIRMLRDQTARLTWLDLSYTRVTDQGLRDALADAPRLDHLNLEGTAVTDRLLPQVATLPALTTLDLSKTQVTDAGLVHLAELKQLATLHVEATRVTPAGLARLDRALPQWNPPAESDHPSTQQP